MIVVNQKANITACVDIGGTKALLGLVDSEGSILARQRYLLGNDRGAKPIAGKIIAKLRTMIVDLGQDWNDVLGIGCSAAVMADIAQGMIFSAPNIFPEKNVPFTKILEELSGKPAFLEMDAYAAARGEAWLGAGQGVNYFVYIVVGTGVGAGILRHGEVFRGAHGTAGEFGHMIIHPDGLLCTCGCRGCLEAYAAGPAISVRARRLIEERKLVNVRRSIGGMDLSPEVILDRARKNDPFGIEVIEGYIEDLAIGVTSLIHLLDPQMIAFGGGVMCGGGDVLLPLLREAVRKKVGNWINFDALQMTMARLGEDAALLGAAQCVQVGLRKL